MCTSVWSVAHGRPGGLPPNTANTVRGLRAPRGKKVTCREHSGPSWPADRRRGTNCPRRKPRRLGRYGRGRADAMIGHRLVRAIAAETTGPRSWAFGDGGLGDGGLGDGGLGGRAYVTSTGDGARGAVARSLWYAATFFVPVRRRRFVENGFTISSE